MGDMTDDQLDMDARVESSSVASTPQTPTARALLRSSSRHVAEVSWRVQADLPSSLAAIEAEMRDLLTTCECAHEEEHVTYCAYSAEGAECECRGYRPEAPTDE